MKRTGQKMNVGSQCNAEGEMEIVMQLCKYLLKEVSKDKKSDVSKFKAWSENSRSHSFGLHDRTMFKWRKEVRILI